MSKRNDNAGSPEGEKAEGETVATLETADLLIADGFANDNAETVVLGITTAMIAEAAQQVRGVKSTLNYRVSVGNGLVCLARLARDAKQGGKDVTAAEAEKAATHFGFTAGQVSRSFAGLCIRTVKVFAGQVDTLVAVASGLFDTPEGPISMSATDLLLWAEKRANVPVKASNAGQAQPRDRGEKDAADAAKAEKAEKADQVAKGRRDLIAQTVTEQPKHKVAGLILLTTLNSASTDNLETLKQTVSDILETRAIAAKAENDRAAKDAAAVKAEAEAEILEMRKQAKAEAEAIIAAAKAKAAKVAV